MRKPVLIVGGDGIIGSYLAASLMRSGQSVVITTRRGGPLASNELFLDLENISGLEKFPEFRTVVLCAAVTSNECSQVVIKEKVKNVFDA